SQLLFGGAVEAFGALGLLTIWMNRGRLRTLNTRRVTHLIVALASTAFVSLLIYLSLLSLCVIDVPGRTEVVFPLWTTGEMSQMIATAGSRGAAVDRYGSGAVEAAIRKMPGVLLTASIILLLVVYQTVFTSLTVAFGLAAYRVT